MCASFLFFKQRCGFRIEGPSLVAKLARPSPWKPPTLQRLRPSVSSTAGWPQIKVITTQGSLLDSCGYSPIWTTEYFHFPVYDNNHGAEAHRLGGFGLEDSFRPMVHQSTEEQHQTGLPTKLSSYDHASVSCIYEKEGTRMMPEESQRRKLSVNVPCCNIHLYPKENEPQPKIETNMAGNQDSKVLVEYDNFPPNKTIGPEMKVVIPPLPTQNSFNRSSPKDTGCLVQYSQMRPAAAAAARFNHFSPIQAAEAQDFTDSDSDWEHEAMVGFGAFMWWDGLMYHKSWK